VLTYVFRATFAAHYAFMQHRCAIPPLFGIRPKGYGFQPQPQGMMRGNEQGGTRPDTQGLNESINEQQLEAAALRPLVF
jgi:hypothetical protein